MAARKSTRVHRKYKTKYRVTNWREYERGLKSRGDITVWFSEEARDAWTPPNNGRHGGQPHYSNLAILTALALRMVFGLALRQTEGFLDSLLKLMELDLKAPDHTTLSRRNKGVDVPAPTRVHDGPIHLIVDSTGLKISGAGEWHTHRHKSSKARRQWRKLHVGVDDDGYIVAATLTKNSVDDPSIVPELVEQIDSPIKRFTADGAYDTRPVYELLDDVGAADIKIVIPPRRGAVASSGAEGTWAQRNATLETIANVGRQGWQRESRYRLQGGVENLFFRYKRTLGDSPSRARLRIPEARGDDRVQRIEPDG